MNRISQHLVQYLELQRQFGPSNQITENNNVILHLLDGAISLSQHMIG